MKKTIAWEKWTDPYMIDEPTDDLIDDSYSDGEDEEGSYFPMVNQQPSEHIKLAVTPFGAMRLTLPNEAFNLWVCHTNFPINKVFQEQVDKTIGVELFHPLTRYRAQVGVGKMFETNVVLSNINDAVSAELDYTNS